MRIGIMFGETVGSTSLDGMLGQIRAAQQAGFSTAWTAQLLGWDALTALAIVGREVPDIALGTAVVPTYPRHPIVLASQALSVQAATGNRLTLGIGLSHQVVIEEMFGYSFDKPARHMREYLSALDPLLRGESVSYQGETLKANATVNVPGALPPPLLVAALGPVMLKMAGELAHGTVTWMTGPATLASHVVPTITEAAAAAGRPAPRVVAGFAICVTDDPGAARSQASEQLAIYGQLPSYRAMLDREGVTGPADVALVGDELTIRKEVERLDSIGVTELLAAPFGSADEQRRTVELLAQLVSITD
jgi:F420-dependent oxidoreductase-like protein